MNQSEKATIVILSTFFEPYMSGAEQMVKEILDRLGDKYNLVLLTARLSRVLAKKENRSGYIIYRLGFGCVKLDKFIYPFLAALKIKRIKPDIAHAIMESYAGGALVLAKYFYPPARRILTLQSGDLDSPNKQKQFFLRLFWRVIHQDPNKITAISSFLANRARRLGVNEKNIFIVPNGVDLKDIPIGIEREEGRVLCVARLSWEKGIDYLLQAWPMVLESARKAKLVIVGEGRERPKIEKMIQDLNLASGVELKGNLPHKQVLEEMARAAVFVLPSLAEGLGIVILEAQAAGAPVVATRVGGIPDIIKDGKNGFLVEPKSPRQLAAAIVKLLKDKKLRKRLSEEGLKTCRKFVWDVIMEKIEKIYFAVLK